MVQFGAALAAASNPFCVNGEQILSRNREMPGDMRAAPSRVSPDRRRGVIAPS